MVVSESSFGAYVCHRRPAGLHRHQRLLSAKSDNQVAPNHVVAPGGFLIVTVTNLSPPTNSTLNLWLRRFLMNGAKTCCVGKQKSSIISMANISLQKTLTFEKSIVVAIPRGNAPLP